MPKMKVLSAIAAALVFAPVVLVAQNKAATYITKEQVDTVNKQTGTDRTIRVLDIGHENFAVGVIHRGPTGGGARGAAGGGAAGGAAAAGGGGRAGAAAAPAEPCGETASAPPPAGTPTGLFHDSQTEGYYIISGAGTMVTGDLPASRSNSAGSSVFSNI